MVPLQQSVARTLFVPRRGNPRQAAAAARYFSSPAVCSSSSSSSVRVSIEGGDLKPLPGDTDADEQRRPARAAAAAAAALLLHARRRVVRKKNARWLVGRSRFYALLLLRGPLSRKIRGLVILIMLRGGHCPPSFLLLPGSLTPPRRVGEREEEERFVSQNGGRLNFRNVRSHLA